MTKITIDAETEIRLQWLANVSNHSQTQIMALAVKKLERIVKAEIHNFIAMENM